MRPLHPEQIHLYHEQGFLLVKGFIDPSTIDGIRREVRELHHTLRDAQPEGVRVTWEEDLQPPLIRQLMGSQNVCGGLATIADSPQMIGAMEQLLGGEVELFHSKLMMKAAGRGSFTPWHADWNYWERIFEAPQQMNAFLAIDASTLENGCIRYVPGSHRSYEPPTVNREGVGFGLGYEGCIEDREAIPVEMEPGDVAFHGSFTLHASEANRSQHDRIMNTFAFTRTGCLKAEEEARANFEGQRLQVS